MNETEREQLDEILGSGENGVDKATARATSTNSNAGNERHKRP